MKKFFIVLISIFSIFGFTQDQFSDPTYIFPKIKSSITMPVQIPLSEISNMVNSSVQGLIFQDNSYEDNDNDQFKVKVWKARPIRIAGGVKNNLIIAVPLKIWAEKGIGTLGLYNYQSTTFEAEMYFSTELKVNTNWTIDTKTISSGFKWVSKPVLDFGPVKIPITSLVEKSLKEEQTKFTKIIDEQMKEQLNFQQMAITTWNLFAEPFEISEEYKTWLKITPLKINLTPLKFYGDQLQTAIGIDVYSETFTGLKPETSPNIGALANFNFVPQLDNIFTLYTTANIPFDAATRIAEETFLHKKYEFREGKSNIVIENIKVYRENDKVVIEAKTSGTISGITYLSGVPIYDEARQKIVLSETKFKLKTKNIFQKSLTLLFKNKIINMIEDDYGIPTADLEQNSKKSIEDNFNQHNFSGVNVNAKVFKIKPQQIVLSTYGITAVIAVEAQVKIKFRGL